MGGARWRNDDAAARGEVPPIPENSISKPPSAELRPDQLDSDSLPDYALLDDILDAYVEHDRGAQELLDAGFPHDLVDRIVRLIDTAEYKRRQYRPAPRSPTRRSGEIGAFPSPTAGGSAPATAIQHDDDLARPAATAHPAMSGFGTVQIDEATLAYAATLDAVVFLLVPLFLMTVVDRAQRPSLRYWAAGGAALATSSLVTAMTLKTDPTWELVVTNALSLLGLGWIFIACDRLLGGTAQRRWVYLLAALIMLTTALLVHVWPSSAAAGRHQLAAGRHLPSRHRMVACSSIATNST